jgi:hypothetical protein
MSINPENYQRNWKGELHCVRFEQGFMNTMLEEAGLSLFDMKYETETDGQSALYVCKPSLLAGSGMSDKR